MMIPDCRSDETYNEKHLSHDDATYITGFDACVDACVDNFFNNIDEFPEEMEAAGIDPEDIDYDIINSDTLIANMTEEEISKLSPSTRMIKAVKDAMLQYAESERDETITVLIDGMDEEELEKNIKGVKEGTYKNAIVLEQEWQEKFQKGEIPTCWEIKKSDDGKIIRIGHCPNGNKIIQEEEN